MENPFTVKDDRSDTGVFPPSLTVPTHDDGNTQNQAQNIDNNEINSDLVRTQHNLMVMHQGSRVALPTYNATDQPNNQENLSNEMVDLNTMYTSLAPSEMSNVILTYEAQRMGSEPPTHIDPSNSIKGVDITEESQKRLNNTLVGNKYGPLSTEEILDKIGDKYQDLRKVNGTKYKDNKVKAVNGALYSTGIFKTNGDKWTLKETERKQYEKRIIQRFENEGKKKRYNQDETNPNEEEKGKKRKYTNKQAKKSDYVKMLRNIAERLRQSSDKQTEVFFKNPFNGLKGTDELLKVRKKLGEEKFEIAIQMYNYFDDALNKLCDADSPMYSLPINVQTEQLIQQLQHKIDILTDRLNQLEKANRPNDMSI